MCCNISCKFGAVITDTPSVPNWWSSIWFWDVPKFYLASKINTHVNYATAKHKHFKQNFFWELCLRVILEAAIFLIKRQDNKWSLKKLGFLNKTNNLIQACWFLHFIVYLMKMFPYFWIKLSIFFSKDVPSYLILALDFWSGWHSAVG